MGQVQARTGTVAPSVPLAGGVGELELAVVFIPFFRSGTEDLDGVMGAARDGTSWLLRCGERNLIQLLPLNGFTTARVVTLPTSTPSGTPTFNRSPSTDLTGVVGKARPKGWTAKSRLETG